MRESYIKNRYNRDSDDWPLYHPKHYTPLTIIHHEGRRTESEIASVAQEFSSDRIMKNKDTYIDYDRTIKDINDIFTPYEGVTPHPYRILIEGAPGVGKTILSKEIAFQWANHNLLNSKKLLFLLFMRDPQIKSITSVRSLVSYYCQKEALGSKVADWLANTDGKYLTIVLDGYDEVSEDSRSHFIRDVLNRKQLKKCSLVITSRPTVSANLHDIVDCRAEVLGFIEKNRKDFIRSALQGQPDKITELERFLESNPFLNTLCYIPLIMSILLCITVDGVDALPKTQTRLFENFVLSTMVHFLKKRDKITTNTITSFNDLPHPYDHVINELSQFAFLALQKNQLVFTPSEAKAMCPNLTLTNWYGLGLVKRAQYFKPQDCLDHESFHFLHFSIQEYMAAHYIASLPDNEQFELLNDAFWNVHFFNMWVMYVGITGGDNFAFRHFLTGNYFQLSSRMFGTQNISKTILSNKIKCLHLLHCFAEADHEMLSFVESIFQGGIIDLSHQSLSPNDVHTLAVLLLRSPNKQWEMLNLSHCNIDEKSCNVLYELFRSQHVALNIKTVDISCNHFYWESLRKIYSVLKCWSTTEIILSIDALYNSETVNFIHNITNALKANIQHKQPRNKMFGMLLVTCVPEQNQVVTVYSSASTMRCFQLGYERTMMVENIKNWQLGIGIVPLYIGTIFTVPSARQSVLLSNFQLVRVCGFALHSKAVYLHSNVSTIELSHNISPITQYVADYLTSVICHTYQSNKSYLKTLSLHNSDEVKNSLRKLTSLQYIFISNNQFGSEAAGDIAKILLNNTKLLKLYIWGNNLRTSGAIEIARGLQNTSALLEFSISYNNIGSEAAGDIAAVLSHNLILRKILINNNNLETSGAITIARGLTTTKSLTMLDISNNNIGSEAADDIATVLSHNFKLQNFNISGNNLETSGAIIVSRSLQHLKSLLEFNISNNNIGSEAADDIAAVFSHNTKLKMFWMHNNNLGTSGTIKIARALQSISSLITCSISNNNIGSEAADDIAGVLSHNTKLQTFYAWKNNLQTSGAIKIARGLTTTKSLTMLDISNNNIGSEAADDIATVLSHNFKLQNFNISGNNLETSGAIIVSRSLQHLKSLLEFNISNNNIGSEAADDIAAVFSHNTKLKMFWMHNNNLGTSGTIKIARALQSISSLITCSISNNNIGSEAADDIAGVLSHNTKLQNFYAWENNLQTSGAIKIARGLQHTKSLLTFQLSSNRIGSKAANDIAAVLLKNTKLQSLTLQRNNLEASGVIEIFRALQNHSFLRELNISNNDVSSEAADDIAAVLSHNIILKKFYIWESNLGTSGAIKVARGLQNIKSLIEFDISSNNIGSEAADDIAVALSRNTGLQKLYLQINKIGTTGIINIARALQNTSSLTIFNISNNNIGSEAADDIAAILFQSTKLQAFLLQNNNIGTTGAIKIARGLQNVTSLTELNISSNSIGDEAADNIAAVLLCNTGIEQFTVSRNNFEMAGAMKITSALQSTKFLKQFSLTVKKIHEGSMRINLQGNFLNVHGDSIGLLTASFQNDSGNATRNGSMADDALSIAFSQVKVCSFSNINLDSPVVLRFLGMLVLKISSLTELYINRCTINNEATHYIEIVLSHNLKLQTLRIINNDLETGSAIKIARALLFSSYLTELDISNNNIGNENANAIADALSQNTQLQKLCINGNCLHTPGARQIARALHNTSTLTHFNLSNNNIGSEAADEIATILSLNTNLEVFNASRNSLETSGAIKIAKQSQSISSLTEFSISSNNIGSEAADDIAAVLHCNTGIKQFTVDGNSFNAASAVTIIRALHKTKLLVSFTISVASISAGNIRVRLHNNSLYIYGDIDNFNNARAVNYASSESISHFSIDDELKSDMGIVFAKVESLHLNKIHFNDDTLLHLILRAIVHNISTLKEMNISNNKISSEAEEDISIALSHNADLQRLIIQHNIIETVSMSRVTRAVQDVSSLTVFSISNNNIASEAAGDIASILSHNRQLQEFYIQGNSLKTSGAIVIAQSLQKITSLKSCNISNNKIGDEAAGDIAAILCSNTGIKQFMVENNNFNTVSALTIIRALHNSEFVIYFSVSIANFSAEGVANVKVLLRGNSLLVHGENISATNESFYTTSESGLKHNVDSEAVKDLTVVVAKVKSCHLNKINLENTEIANFVGALICVVSSLTVVDIAESNIGSEAADDIVAVLTHNTELQNFRLCKNKMEISNTIKIIKSLQNISSLTKFDISSNHIKSEAADDIAAVLSHNVQLHFLQIYGNNIGNLGTIKIIKASQGLKSLTEFNISNNNIGDEAADDIATFLSQNSQLKRFNICGNSLETSGGKKIASALQKISSLTSCDLSNNSIGDDAVGDICAILCHNSGIINFMVDNNNFSMSSTLKIIRALSHTKCRYFSVSIINTNCKELSNISVSIKNNSLLIQEDNLCKEKSQLLHCTSPHDISSYNIDSEAVSDIAAVLAKVTDCHLKKIHFEKTMVFDFLRILIQNVLSLKKIQISNCNIDNEAVEAITLTLSHSIKLQDLRIQENVIDVANIIKIVKSLQNISYLMEVDISNNNIGSEVASEISTLLCPAIKLKTLSIHGNSLETAGAVKIARGLNNISTLTKLDISNNKIGSEAADDIAFVLIRNSILQILRINQNNLQASGTIKVINALKHVSSLIELDISSNNIASEAVNEITAALIQNTKFQIQISENNLKAPDALKFTRVSHNIPLMFPDFYPFMRDYLYDDLFMM